MSTPMALATTSQSRLCHAAPATACASGRGETLGSGECWLMDSPIVHLQEAVAAPGEAAIVRSHHQGDALGGDKVEQHIEDRAA